MKRLKGDCRPQNEMRKYFPENRSALSEKKGLIKVDCGQIYYDHEDAYRQLRAEGLNGWKPSSSAPCRSTNPSHFHEFLESEFASAPGSALDLGCGGGQISILLAKRGWRVTGIDYSRTALEMARENALASNVDAVFLWGDAAKTLSVVPSGFSLAIDNAVCHCLIDADHRKTFMSNAYAALEDGGILFSANSCADGIPDYSHPNARFDPLTRIALNHRRYWATLEERLSEFRSAGFQVLSLELSQKPQKDFCSSAVIIAKKVSNSAAPPPELK